MMTIKDNYLLYQKKISKIEGCIVSNYFDEALDIFKSVMKNHHFIFPRDAYLAAQIASYLNEYKVGEFFLMQAIVGGCSEKVLKKNLHIKKIISQMGDLKFEKFFFEYNQMHLQSISTKVKEDVLSLYRKDRQFLLKYNKLSSFFSRKEILTEWDAFSAKATPEIKEIIKKEGFPSYKTIGTETEEHYGRNDFKDFISSHMAIILLSHDQENIKSMMDNLFNEVVKGNLSSRALAFLRDVITYKRISGKKMKGDEFDSYQYGTFLFLDKNTNYSLHYNAERERIGLCSLETEKKKYYMNKRYLRKSFWKRRSQKFDSPFFHFFLEDIC